MLMCRRYLGWVVSAWLASQICGVVAAPALLSIAATAHDGEECDCPLLPGQACPMHHSGTHGGKHDDSTCRLRNAFDGQGTALLALSGGFGVLPEPAVPVARFDQIAMMPPSAPFPLVRASLPEAPPPRA